MLRAAALAVVAGAGLMCALVGAEASRHAAAQFQIDDSPLARDARPPVSCAPVVRKIAPGVVSIFTTKKVASLRFHDTFPFFDDPRFRRWFGEGPGDRPRSRPQFRKEHGLGSGVIVTKDGYILSNNHVVDGADEIKVALADEKQQFAARVIGRDPQTDIAVLKIEASDLPAMTLTDSDKLEVGDLVLAVGNPFGVGQSVSHGIVSAVGRGGLGLEDYEDFIQTDAPINPGNSGGALVDVQGRLVGINTAIATRTGSSAGVGFAVPVNLARGVMDRLLKEGRVVRGYLGVGIQDLTAELAKEFEAPDTRGALVTQVEPKGAADEAGLKTGDVIIEFDGKAVTDSRQLRLLVAHTAPGRKVELKALRQAKTRNFQVTLKELPGTQTARGEDAPDEKPNEVLRNVAVRNLTPALRRQFDIPEHVTGALVSEVPPDSPAYEAGLRPGDVVMEVNQKSIRNTDDAVQATRNVPSRRVLLRIWSQGGSRFLVVDESKQK
jgi:serine protease Do